MVSITITIMYFFVFKYIEIVDIIYLASSPQTYYHQIRDKTMILLGLIKMYLVDMLSKN